MKMMIISSVMMMIVTLPLNVIDLSKVCCSYLEAHLYTPDGTGNGE